MGNPITDGSLRTVEAEMPLEIVDKCRATLARHATDADELRDLMAMLGVLPKAPGPERKPGYCPVCGGELPLEAHSPKAGLHGTCSRACARQLRGLPREKVPCPGCGQTLPGDGSACRRCANTVDANTVRATITRIQGLFEADLDSPVGMGRIAMTAEVSVATVKAIAAADSTVRRVTPEVAGKLDALAARLEAGEVPVVGGSRPISEAVDNLRLLREDAGLAWSEIAYLTGLSKSTLTEIMRTARAGTRRWVSAKTADQIASIIDRQGAA